MDTEATQLQTLSPAALAVQRYGSAARLARALQRHPAQVCRWLKRGTIPSRLLPALLRQAESDGVSLTAEDLILGRV